MSTSQTEETTDHRSGKAAKVEHFTTAERAARGKAARAEVPRSAHGEWEPAPHRPDPVELLEEQAATRVPELVPIRYGRMLVSPFTFYRGAAYLMASDLADGPRTGLHAQLCGDAHLSNFGVFAAPDRRLVFGVNDFDETLPGPFEWDVKRLVASFAVAGRDRGFDDEDAGRRSTQRSRPPTARRCSSFAAMRNLDIWYDAHRRRGDHAERSRRRPPPSRGSGWTRTSPRRGRRTACGVRQADRDRRRRAADRQRPAADRPDRRAGRRRRGGARSRGPARPRSAHTGGRSRATGGSCSSGSASSTRPARSSASAASGRGPGSC